MVDVKELKIGNIVCVKYKDGSHVVTSIVKDDAYSGGYCIQFDNGDKCSLDYVIPMPLTEELLLKCGFKKTGDFAFEYKDDADLIFDAPNDWNNTNDYPVGISSIDPGYPAMYIPHGEVIIRCLYLHDLQNKFFAITGKELEVNNKEENIKKNV